MIKTIFKRIEDFFIPPLCVICDSALSDDRWLCQSCLDALASNSRSRDACPRCSQNRRVRECGCEFAWDFPFEKIHSIYDYDDTIRSVARHIKYKGKRRLAYHIGFISAAMVSLDFFDGVDAVVPVPLHKLRKRKRGYNQAEFLARGILDGLGGDKPALLRTDLLLRVRSTGTQTKLDRDERMKNLAGAFAVNPEKLVELKGMRVVLVDDILTTGATVEACTEELLRAGCASVVILSLGRD